MLWVNCAAGCQPRIRYGSQSRLPCVGTAQRVLLKPGGSVVITLAIIYIVRRLKAAKRARVQIDSPQMSTGFTAPLLTTSRPMPSRSGEREYSYISSPDMDSSSSHESHSASIYSPSSEGFHFPILSADGHLLPPAPASSRAFINSAQESDLGSRPLPLSPADCSSVYFSGPPKPSQWSVQSRHEYSPVVGIYPEGNYVAPQPQRAVFHRSFADEGEEIADADVTEWRGR
jgi:hypothetical protein